MDKIAQVINFASRPDMIEETSTNPPAVRLFCRAHKQNGIERNNKTPETR